MSPAFRFQTRTTRLNQSGAKPGLLSRRSPMTNTDFAPDETIPRWHALWTHGHCELLVFDQLIAKGFDAFLPRVRTWSRRGKKRHLITEPMFPGYLFLRHAIDRHAHVEILKTRGLAGIVGERRDRPAI